MRKSSLYLLQLDFVSTVTSHTPPRVIPHSPFHPSTTPAHQHSLHPLERYTLYTSRVNVKNRLSALFPTRRSRIIPRATTSLSFPSSKKNLGESLIVTFNNTDMRASSAHVAAIHLVILVMFVLPGMSGENKALVQFVTTIAATSSSHEQQPSSTSNNDSVTFTEDTLSNTTTNNINYRLHPAWIFYNGIPKSGTNSLRNSSSRTHT